MPKTAKTKPPKGPAGSSSNTLAMLEKYRHLLMRLEQRIAFDAATLPTIEAVHDQVDHHFDSQQDAEASQLESLVEALATIPVTSSEDLVSSSHEVVIVDASVSNYAAILDSLEGDYEIVILDPTLDGVEQMANVVGQMQDVSAVHIISHGSAGQLQLGSAVLNLQTIAGAYADELARLQGSLTADADILIYGCDFASGEMGSLTAQFLSTLTGADVAASDDKTGSSLLGADWDLEYQVGTIEASSFHVDSSVWTDTLTINVSIATSATQMAGVVSPAGESGITISGTPTLNAATSTNAFGTFTTTSSNLGLTQGIVIGSGDVTQVSGTPSAFWNGAGTGVSGSGSERDLATLNMSFTTDSGVTKLVAQYVMGSEEYNEYVGQGFSDNVRVVLNGGSFSNQNIAVIPNTSTGVDIDTVNNSTNSAYYRDNTVGSPPVSDTSLDGLTVVINNVVSVSANTTYSAAFSTADFIDNQYNSATFISYFGSSLRVDLDGNNSSGITNGGFSATYTENGSAIAIADSDTTVTNYDTTTDVTSATIVLTNAQTGDSLSVGSLPSGISASVDTSVPGQITVTLSGSASEASYATALNAITFSNSSENPNTTARDITVVLNDGATNSNTVHSTINVTAVNDAPVNTLPGAAWATNVSTNLQLSGLSIADVDAGVGTITTTLAVGGGTLTATSGGGVVVAGSGTGTLVLTGTLANINSFLGSGSAPVFVPSAGVGNVTLTMTTSDGGNTGTGGTLTDVDIKTITIDQAPIVDLNSTPAPWGGFGTSTSNLVTTGGFGTAASATPPLPWVEGAAAGAGAVVLNGTDGRWDWTTAPGATATLTQAITVPAPTTTTTFTGNSTTVTTTSDVLSSISFGIAWQNQDNTNSNTLTVTYNGVVYATLTTLQAGGANLAGLVGTWTYSNGATGPATTNSVTNEITGTLTTVTITLPGGVTSSGNLVFTYGDGVGFGTAHDDISIDNVVVTSTRTTTTTVTTADTADNDWTATFTEGGSAVSIADTDSSVFDGNDVNMESATITLTNQQTGDRLLVNGSSGASGTLTSGISWTRTDTTVTFSGGFSKADYADAIELVTFENTDENPNTAVTRDVTVTVSDGDLTSNTAHAYITVVAVNDAPVNTLPATFNTNEDTALSLAGLSVSDVDAASGTITVTLSVTSGTLSAISSGGVTVTGSGSASMVLSGTLTDINSFLGTAGTRPSFTPASNSTASVTLTMLTSDGGSTGSGGTLTDSDTSVITVNPVNDAPVNTLPVAGWTTPEDIAVQLTGLSVADVDAGTGTMTVTLSVPTGSLVALSAGGVTVTGSGTSALTLTGTLADINSYLGSGSAPSYTPVANANGTVVLTMLTSDGGNTGSGGTLTDSDARDIVISPVNDPAVIGGDDSGAVTEDATSPNLSDSGTLTISDADTGEASFTPATVAGTYGAVAINAAGAWTYTAANSQTAIQELGAGDTLTDTITVTSLDGTAHVITITITGVNDAPVASAHPLSSQENTPATGAIVAADVDGDALIFTVGTGPANGTLILNPNGSYSYQPNPGFSGSDSFIILVDDGHGGVTEVLVPVTIEAANGNTDPVGTPDAPEPPVWVDDSGSISAEGAVDEMANGMSPLNSVQHDLGIHGLVNAVVNLVQDLNGLNMLGTDGEVIRTVDGMNRSESSRPGIEDLEDFRGGSLLNMIAEAGEDGFSIEAKLHNGLLYINIVDPTHGKIVDFRITRDDGRALPDFIKQLQGRALIIERQAGEATISLKITAIYDDGHTVSGVVDIDLLTGSISIQEERPASSHSNYFTDQLEQQAWSFDEEQDLLAALSRIKAS